MAPLRGWGTRGERLITHVPHGHWQTMTFIGALRHDRIEAPWVLNGPINAEAFKTYVRVELIKTLKPNDIVRCEKPCVEASRPSKSAVADTLDTITPQECSNYLANAGYKSS